MRNYELGLILHPDLEQEDVPQAVEKVGQYVEASGGKVVDAKIWGRRVLAYPIRKQKEGTYVFVQAEMDPHSVGELERSLKLDENVLRHLLVHEEA